MSQTLIPLGLLFFLALFVFAFVREARKQRAASSRMYEELAQRKGWRFESPSQGKLVPKNVVSGTVAEGRVWLYEHSRPVQEGEHHRWSVCLIETDGEPRAPTVIRFSTGSRTLRARNQCYTGEELPLPEPLRRQLIIYSHEQEAKQHAWPTEFLEQLMELTRQVVRLLGVSHPVAVS